MRREHAGQKQLRHAQGRAIRPDCCQHFIRYAGGKFPYTLWFIAPMLNMETSVAVWRTLAELASEQAITNIAHHNAGDTTSATRFIWGADPKELRVGLLRIDNGGHAEPSKVKRYPRLFSWFPGAQNADVEVAEEALEFFKDKRSGLLPCASGHSVVNDAHARAAQLGHEHAL